MGLFTKKDPCAICGGKVKGLFPWKVDGKYVCGDCYGVTDLPEGAVDKMTVEDFKAYMAFREENRKLKAKFKTTDQIDFGWLDTKFLFDRGNRLLCMNKNLDATIFEGPQIRSFVIMEDRTPVLEGTAEGLRHYPSTVPERAMAMAPQIDQFMLHVQLMQGAERLRSQLGSGDRSGDHRSGANNNNPPPPPPPPRFDVPEPFKDFHVEIYFDHPYWQVFTANLGGPTFDNERPNVQDYLAEYDKGAATMAQLAGLLMAVAFPGAGEIVDEPQQQTAAAAGTAAVDTVEELKRYKALVEQGVLTEEEFTAKKRQLLGI